METLSVISEVVIGNEYLFGSQDNPLTLMDKPSQRKGIIKPIIPSFPSSIKIPYNWKEAGAGEVSSSNILGGNGVFNVGELHSLEIPQAETTKENLAFYGAKLLTPGERISFEVAPTPGKEIEKDIAIPLTKMKIGKDYVKEYLLKDKAKDGSELGGGAYVEKHDRPHFHMPLTKDSGGVLILGKKVEGELYLSAFKITYGKAIYTPGNIPHSDAYLYGEYAVVYSFTQNASTVIFKSGDGKIVDVGIKEIEMEKARSL